MIPYSSSRKLIFVSNLDSPPSPNITRMSPPLSRYFFRTSNYTKDKKNQPMKILK
jgi:hypothetical protein